MLGGRPSPAPDLENTIRTIDNAWIYFVIIKCPLQDHIVIYACNGFLDNKSLRAVWRSSTIWRKPRVESHKLSPLLLNPAPHRHQLTTTFGLKKLLSKRMDIYIYIYILHLQAQHAPALARNIQPFLLSLSHTGPRSILHVLYVYINKYIYIYIYMYIYVDVYYVICMYV